MAMLEILFHLFFEGVQPLGGRACTFSLSRGSTELDLTFSRPEFARKVDQH